MGLKQEPGMLEQPPAKASWLARASNRFRKGGKLQPFRLLRQDIHNLRLRYVSDWTVFNQLVVASAVYVFFTNILPGITFANDLFVLTGESWGTIEVVFSTGLCGLIFSLFSAQPLTILGVTGPFSVLAENMYKLCTENFHVPFLPVMAWSLIHSAWMHYLLAIFNAHDSTMQYVTNFSADIFSLLNSVIYFHKASLELKRNHDNVPFDAFLYSIIGAFGTCLLAIFLSTALDWKPLFGRIIRMGLAEYAAAISIIFFIGVPYMGELANLEHERLSIQKTFRPTSPNRDTFFVKFWEVPLEWVFISIIPGAIITVLFYFDHEISSIICTVERYGVRKPGGYAWDIVLLGTTTALCGILGIPPANGLLPQAPLHSESLRHWVEVDADDSDSDSPLTTHSSPSPSSSPSSTTLSSPNITTTTPPKQKKLIPRVHEQRYSPFLQSALILCFISPPFQHLLGFTPTSVLAGLFMYMGYQSLSVNPILPRFFELLSPPSELPPLPNQEVSRWAVHGYTLTQIVLTGIIFWVTLTVAAPGFPVIIIILVPVRLWIMNRIWGRETLRFVDGWACRPGKPEDSEEEKAARREGEGVLEGGRDAGDGGVSESERAGDGDVDVDVERGLARTSSGVKNGGGVREKQS
ncbi:HCO3 transporter family-domain-containing protein [Pseudoneurospora amorphoporcata]|uniref:HCO3 transporter family-domain-containing protein n=1 Tax=Pseudoneurospora amorphoporcata TaxID=241081 RepID=A0AAN6NXH1_9PEZI|nr:HCO3 transporter family-domain-containing protein [Pseudoneurospora amorphoporcata]